MTVYSIITKPLLVIQATAGNTIRVTCGTAQTFCDAAIVVSGAVDLMIHLPQFNNARVTAINAETTAACAGPFGGSCGVDLTCGSNGQFTNNGQAINAINCFVYDG